MKTTIYYFTGTGNSLMVARNIAQKLGDCEVVSIAKLINGKINLSAESIGIVFPVYIWGIPLIVSRFINKLNVENKDKYIWGIATNGGTVAGSLEQIDKKLKTKGLKLSAGFSVRMPSNYVPMVTDDNEEEIFGLWESKLNEIVQIVKNRTKYKIEKGSAVSCIFNTGIVNRILSRMMPVMDKQYSVEEKCNGCGLCSKICPVGNIAITNKKPEWKHKCEMCFACINNCPKEAIQYGKNTVGKKRYRNCRIDVKDLMN